MWLKQTFRFNQFLIIPYCSTGSLLHPWDIFQRSHYSLMSILSSCLESWKNCSDPFRVYQVCCPARSHPEPPRSTAACHFSAHPVETKWAFKPSELLRKCWFSVYSWEIHKRSVFQSPAAQHEDQESRHQPNSPLPNTHTHAHTHAHAHIHTHPYRHTHTGTGTRTPRHKHTPTHTGTCTKSHTQAHSHTHSFTFPPHTHTSLKQALVKQMTNSPIKCAFNLSKLPEAKEREKKKKKIAD